MTSYFSTEATVFFFDDWFLCCLLFGPFLFDLSNFQSQCLILLLEVIEGLIIEVDSF